MIKFFRKIRQNLLSEGKTGKYFKYAVGEIVLVVIGILIALYINNWNLNRLQEIDELKSLKFLKAEFENNILKFDKNQNLQKKRLDAINEILFADLSRNDLNEIDSLYKLAFYSWTYNPSFSTYNSLVSSGKINQFSNDSLKIRLSKLKDLVTDYQEDEENLWNHSKDYLFTQEIFDPKIPSETKFNLRSRDSIEESNDKLLYLEIFSNPEYRNKLALAILHLELIRDEGVVLKKELVELYNIIADNVK